MRTPARYRHLARIIVDEATRHCDEVDLEFYLAAERGGKDAPTLYPRIHQHLQTCARCRKEYEQRRQGLPVRICLCECRQAQTGSKK